LKQNNEGRLSAPKNPCSEVSSITYLLQHRFHWTTTPVTVDAQSSEHLHGRFDVRRSVLMGDVIDMFRVYSQTVVLYFEIPDSFLFLNACQVITQ
jgi:hypothetical protein